MKLNQNNDIAIVSIATNGYIEYWETMARSFDLNVNSANPVNLHIFTNDIQRAESIGETLINIKTTVHEIPNLKWPEATLDRYRLIHEHREYLTESLIMYLDADMVVHDDPTEIILRNIPKSGINLIAHPGYYRPKKFKMIAYYTRNISQAVRDLRASLSQGGIGSWETSANSTAFVPRKQRRTYVCGGVWFGERSAIMQMNEELFRNVETDKSRNVLAKWHDESHLNKWASMNEFNLLPPELCFEPNYAALRGLRNIIEAVDKNAQRK
jgi:Glycosyltransferase family 6